MSETIDDPRAGLRQGMYALLIVIAAGAMLGRILAVDSVDRQERQRALKNSIPEELDRVNKRLKAERAWLEGWKANVYDKKDQPPTDDDEQKLKRLKELSRPNYLMDQNEALQNRLRARADLCRPFLSANDRSRWCTVRALVEPEMRVEGAPYAIDKVLEEPKWDTIDKVKHDGHFYSSKPPLFPTLMAAEYWVIYKVTENRLGEPATLGTHPYEIGRFMLITINLVPMVIYLIVLSWMIERFGTTDWGRMFVMGATAFGTFLSTFAITINNHLPAAASAAIALYAAARIWFDGQRRIGYFVLAGLFGAFTVANELPALAFFVPLTLAMLWKSPWRALLAYVPAAAVVVAGFFGTNYIAHNSFRPPYMHRSEGDNWYDYEGTQLGDRETRVGIDRGEDSMAVYAANAIIGHHGVLSLTPVWLLSVAGILLWTWKDPRLRWWALAIGAISAVCLAFYITRPVLDRNYGGMSSGFRWMFWLAPLWLWVMLPAADATGKSRGWRNLALVLLGLSVMSASYPTWNPWSHPWLYNFFDYLHLTGP